PTARNHAHRGYHKHYAQMTQHNPQKHMIPAAVLTQSKPVSIPAVRPVSTVVPKTSVARLKQVQPIVTKHKSPIKRHITRSPSPKTSNSPPIVTVVKAPMVNTAQGLQGKWEWRPKCLILDHGNPQHALKDKGVIDSGCSRYMIENMSYLTDFDELNGGYVSFRGNPKGGKISGKGKIKTGKLDFDDVYFVKELKFNLFSVSQMYVKKNSVLFTNTECLVLSPNFKLPDESQVLLRVPGENNMYNVILLEGYQQNFENDNTCVACKKGKQHKASCKTKPVSFVDQPLYRLHMDLFGPTFVKSLNKKSYCLVVTDDYSRFTWEFFLATKDETSPILKTFITGLENQLSLKVKVIRSDNETEFKNNDLNRFCGMKGIKKEFSVPRTPQQNGIAERKNRTLIKATRTMLADSLLPIVFWAEAVNTACYVQDRVLVTKPQNKTLCKFDGNVDEGFLVGYSVSSKAFRVFNSRTRIVQETLHVNFLENKPNVAYKFNAKKAWEEIDQQYVLFSVRSSGSTNPQNTDGDAAFDGKEPKFNEKKPESEVNVSPSSSAKSRKQDDKTKKEVKGKSLVESFTGYIDLNAEFEDYFDNIINEVNAAGTLVPTIGKISPNSTNTFSAAGPSNAAATPTHGKSLKADFNNLETCITVSPIPTTRVYKDHLMTQIIGDLSLATQTRSMTRVVKDQVDLPYGKRAIGTKWVFRNKKDERGIVVRNKARLVAQGHIQEDGTDYKEVFAPVARIEAIRLFVAYASFMGFMMYQMDVKSAFLFRTIEEEVYVCQPLVFKDPDHPDKVYKVDKYVAEILRKFRLTEGKSASTPIDTEKPLLKDPDGKDVDVHTYMLMIGSLMYLTSSRPDIMFAVCACACFQVTLKASHLHAVKRIFRYLKGKSHLGLWYSKDSPFNLVSYSDSDYAGASLDRKSTTKGCQFLGCRLIFWQCKKQTVVATSSTEAEYVAAAN
nr:hypothetical protein [Tanacetum cinerariifolium]